MSLTALALLLLGAAPEAPRFQEVSAARGVSFTHENGALGRKLLPETMGAGGCALDYDGDGLFDLYLVNSGPLPGSVAPRAPNRLFRNLGGSFEEVTERAGAAGRGYGQGALCGDLDGDGLPEIYLLNFGENALLSNRGDGTFAEVTARARVGDPAWSSSGALFDADGDGDLDLYAVNYLDMTVATHRDCRRPPDLLVYCHPDVYPAAADTFYENLGDGTFRAATAEAGFRDQGGKGLGAVVTDFDRDGRPDLYVSNDSTPNFLFHNLGGGRFAEIGLEAGVAVNEAGKTEAGMGIDAGDVNGDGFPDLIVTNLSLETNTLYLGGPAGFRDGTRGAGLFAPSYLMLGFGVDLADLDNDGDLDLVVTNGDVLDNIAELHDAVTYAQPGQVFDNDGAGHFRELAAAAVGEFAAPRVGRGSITLDLDNDGGLDLAVNVNHDRARLFRNSGRRGHFLLVALAGRAPNTAAVGARLELAAGGRRHAEEARIGSSYQTSGDPRLHFGLGSEVMAGELAVTWPGGRRQVFRRLPAETIVVLAAP